MKRILYYSIFFTISGILHLLLCVDFFSSTPIARSIEITPAQVTLSPGMQQQFQVKVYDQHKHPITGRLKWEATGGTITQQGKYVAGKKIGRYELHVTELKSGLHAKIQFKIVPMIALKPVKKTQSPASAKTPRASQKPKAKPAPPKKAPKKTPPKKAPKKTPPKKAPKKTPPKKAPKKQPVKKSVPQEKKTKKKKEQDLTKYRLNLEKALKKEWRMKMAELEKLKKQQEQLFQKKMQQLEEFKKQLAAQHQQEIQRIKQENAAQIAQIKTQLTAQHREEIQRIKQENAAQIAQIKTQLTAQHQQEIKRIKQENAAQIAQVKTQLTAQHQQEIKRIERENATRMQQQLAKVMQANRLREEQIMAQLAREKQQMRWKQSQLNNRLVKLENKNQRLQQQLQSTTSKYQQLRHELEVTKQRRVRSSPRPSPPVPSPNRSTRRTQLQTQRQWHKLQKIRISSLHQYKDTINRFTTDIDDGTTIPVLDFFDRDFTANVHEVMRFHRMEMIAFPQSQHYFISVNLDRPLGAGRYRKRTDFQYLTRNMSNIAVDCRSAFPNIIAEIKRQPHLYQRRDGHLALALVFPHATARYFAWKSIMVCKYYGYKPSEVLKCNSIFRKTSTGFWSLRIQSLVLKNHRKIYVSDFEERWST